MICNSSDRIMSRSRDEVWDALKMRLGPVLNIYELTQINGQRKFYNPFLRKRVPPPVEGSEVFVGRLPRNLFEDELVPVFMTVGAIYEMRLMMNFSGTNRGFAFVMYDNPETARRAVRELNNYEIRPGHQIGVLASVNNRRLYIGGIPAVPNLESLLFNRLRKLTDGVEAVTVHAMKKQRGRPRCRYALVVYVSHRDAAMARRLLIPHRDDVFGSDVTVDWACPKMEPRNRHNNTEQANRCVQNRKNLMGNSPMSHNTHGQRIKASPDLHCLSEIRQSCLDADRRNVLMCNIPPSIRHSYLKSSPPPPPPPPLTPFFQTPYWDLIPRSGLQMDASYPSQTMNSNLTATEQCENFDINSFIESQLTGLKLI